MKPRAALAAALAAGTVLLAGAPAARAADGLVRDLLRQQSAAERAGCGGIRRVLAGGADAALVVRTAVELGHAPCLVVRCALEGQAPVDDVVRGASAAGVQPDVVARCAVEAGADARTVAVALAEALVEPNYCYFGWRPEGPPEVLPPAVPVVERSYARPQASPFAP